MLPAPPPPGPARRRCCCVGTLLFLLPLTGALSLFCFFGSVLRRLSGTRDARAFDAVRSDVLPSLRSLRPAAMRLDVTDRDRDDVLLAILILY